MRLLLALAMSLATSSFAMADDTRVKEFITAAESKMQAGEAMDALKEGPVEAYFRWGQEICKFLEAGRTPQQIIEGNMDQFFGHELAVALVYASQQVICPDQ